MTRLTGKRLNRELELGAEHARYHKDGYWYDQLQRFPGILFDSQGYVSFTHQGAYEHCPQLRHPDRKRSDGRPGTLSVPDGISGIPGYVWDNRIAALHR
jgi:5-methylcytosine-specific restriction protein A